MPRASRLLVSCVLAGAFLCARDATAWTDHAGEMTVVEVHFTPVANTQIAVWLTDAEGNFIRDVFLTQATGKLGIGNRSGVWNFLSSWRAPYGPRLPVLPVWAHARGVTYPKIIFADTDPGQETSLGFHENSSSAEPFHCRPLLPTEQELILDSMTCPSPSTFRTDKGRFEPGDGSSVYPPRGDIGDFDPEKDHEDIMMYGSLNDVDAVTAATPPGNVPSIVTLLLSDEEKAEPGLELWMEVSLEYDENDQWDYDRELDHFVDPILSTYGVEWLGQPSVIYRVAFAPLEPGTWATSEHIGYGAWDGSDGEVRAPDGSLSTSAGSGADRLKRMDAFDQSFRLAVHTGEGGSCASMDLPPVKEVTIKPIDFDRVSIGFTLPANLPPQVLVRRLEVKQDIDATVETYDSATAIDSSTYVPPLCPLDEWGMPVEDGECLVAMPGARVEFEIASLFGNYDYAFAISYGDQCANEAESSLTDVRTPAQTFQQIDTRCFVATAAHGAHWGEEVWALRRFRDQYLLTSGPGRALIRSYYAYGPTLAKQIKGNALFRLAARGLLSPLAATAEAVAPR